ncbi:MAG: hypothetical protein SO148_01010 [Candidatus Onthovivens sp.]|nr:hypothetical protein [Candidatus Onthovivens sp.]
MTKQEIYNNTREMINQQDKENYMEYYKVYLDNKDRRDIPTEEIEEIVADAYAIYKHKEAELYDILDLAYLDLMEDSNKVAM